ncbi:RNA-binding domain-containing protein [Halolamina sp. C58]|uniref:RNA-binding domain-containing protein n=1 Tax=Halolamina sp. C58 TaxID=3421640 RepID=UPI003EB9043F
MIYSIDVTIEVPVQATEVADRVEDAVTNLFPDAEFRREPDRFVAESHSLDAFSDVLHEQEILDTARREFSNGMDEEGFAFDLKKQPAFEGVVNFAVGSEDELGDIHVRVDVREPGVESFIDHVAPPTEEGRPVDPDDR